MIQNKRRLISLESDIVEDVFNKTGGKYTRNQINDVLISSISYVHYLCSIGDAVVVNVPFLGYMVCNVQKMKSRISVIQKIKEVFNFLCDKKILIGIGIGLILGTSLMFTYKYSNSMTDAKIEEKARGLGMHTKDECKVFFKGDEKND